MPHQSPCHSDLRLPLRAGWQVADFLPDQTLEACAEFNTRASHEGVLLVRGGNMLPPYYETWRAVGGDSEST